VSTRSRMTRRANLERNTTSGDDAWGQPLPPTWTPMPPPVPCWLYTTAKREIVQNQGILVVEDIRAWFPLDADVQHGDRLAMVTDRLGQTLWPGPLEILTVIRRPDHVEALLERHQ
jgi:hypothetical protein